ncbi:MAG: biotin--[acetyl-CoA-carboxylase] ligase [Ginsengibacter sp.]
MSFILKKILVLDSVDSTNNYAMALIRRGEMKGKKAVFAMEQTQGKGRRGKQWESRKGDNIILSVPLQMQWLPISRQFELSVAVALGCRDLITKYVSENVFIKWPNDLFINDSKAGGILIENVLKGTLWQWSVIGIGLNINEEGFETYSLQATSLKNTTGQTYNVLELAEELYDSIFNRIESLQAGNFEKLLQEYNEHLFAGGKKVKLRKQNIVFETTITGVTSSGELVTTDTLQRKFKVNEVEFKGLV